MKSTPVTVETLVSADLSKTWEYWTSPEHIVQWCFASDDWHCPAATNDARTGGAFSSTMASRDGKMSFEFGGVYDEVVPQKRIAYTMEDGRKVEISFSIEGDKTRVKESFDPESENPVEMQRAGWQAILDNFKKHIEG